MKSRIIHLLTFAFFTLASSMTAQIKLSGIVIDANTQKPLEFANVVLLNPDSTFINGVSCDSAGFFTFENLSKGDYLLSSVFVGYDKTYLQVAALDDNRDLGNIALHASSVALQEVTVTGSTVIQKADRKLLIPSITQLKASDSGLTLLRNMQLSRVLVNPLTNTVTTPSGEAVQLRINGVEVTTAEVVAIQPQDVIRIEYHEDPGMRYGNAVAVIDYITRRRESGGSFSTNLSNALWRLGFAEDYLSAKVNHKKSEFSANAYFHYRELNWTHENHETFVFPDGELHRDEVGKPTKLDEKTLNLTLNYNLNEPDKYLFNVTFRNNYNNSPNQFSDRISTIYSPNDSSSISDHSTWWNNTPSLDLYFQRNLKNDQLIIVDAVGTYMDSKSTRLYQQIPSSGEPFISNSIITGAKYSLIAEGIYEKKLKDGKLTGGIRHSQSYTENNYTGSVTSRVGLTVSESYAYAEYQMNRKKFNYTFGAGVMRTFNSQDDNSMEKYIFRPALRVTYTINNNAYIRYNGFISGYAPSLSDLNNVTQYIDALQIQQGNPNLQTVWFASNTINAGYNRKVWGVEFNTQYQYQHHPMMEQISLTDSIFIHTNINQKAFHSVYSEFTLRFKPWKDYITLSVTPGLNHYVSEGTDYFHTYNNWRIRGSIMGAYKNWVISAEAYTRWNSLWGETVNYGEKLIILYAGYNTPKWGAGIMMLNPFTSEYSTGYENRSALAPYVSNIYTHNLGQVVALKFSYNFNFGRKYQAADKRLDNTDTDAGIMTGSKK